MKKIIIVLVVLVVLGAAAYFALGTKTSDWQTYRNTRYEFTVDYPSDWTLGEAEANNAGRELYSSDGEVYCYAYGFANALQNDQGQPQSLDELIDWMVENLDYGEDFDIQVLMRSNSSLANNDAVHIIWDQGGDIRESIYALGRETGIGLFCVYGSQKERDQYKTTFARMARSMKVDVSLDGEAPKQLAACSDLLAGVLTPLKDRKIFFDDQYTEVTLTSRDAWDQKRLPKDMRELEAKGYECFPMPSEFDSGNAGGDLLPQPAVTMVEWSCELEYEEWEYIQGLETMQPPDKFREYNCSKENCWADDASESYVWLCTK